MLSAFLVFIAYLLGSVPFGLVFAHTSGVDIRQAGSKNIGATNVTRLLGKKLGFLTLIADVVKGVIPMALAGWLLAELPTAGLVSGLCGLAAFLGHLYPVFLHFKGGKGVATGLGVFCYLSPVAVLVSILGFVLLVWRFGFVSLGSLVGAALMLPTLLFLGAALWKVGIAGVIVSLIWWQHRENIVRLRQGTEKSWHRKAEQG